jgi:hypothetical protein
MKLLLKFALKFDLTLQNLTKLVDGLIIILEDWILIEILIKQAVLK